VPEEKYPLESDLERRTLMPQMSASAFASSAAAPGVRTICESIARTLYPEESKAPEKNAPEAANEKVEYE
jgi:hypothetical protein